MNKVVLGATLAFVCGLTSVTSRAQPRLPFAPNAVEIQALPVECRAKLTGKPEGVSRLIIQRYGAVWEDFHHYCFALNFMNRARLAPDKNEKKYDLEAAISNFDYVLTHWPSTTPLIPKVRAMKSQVQAMMKSP